MFVLCSPRANRRMVTSFVLFIEPSSPANNTNRRTIYRRVATDRKSLSLLQQLIERVVKNASGYRYFSCIPFKYDFSVLNSCFFFTGPRSTDIVSNDTRTGLNSRRHSRFSASNLSKPIHFNFLIRICTTSETAVCRHDFLHL